MFKDIDLAGVLGMLSGLALPLLTLAVGLAAWPDLPGGLELAVGAQVAVLDCLAFVPLVTLLTVLPTTISGWSVREQSMASLFSLVGAAPVAAGTVSALLGQLTVLTALPGGTLWLLQHNRKPVPDAAFNRIKPHGHA